MPRHIFISHRNVADDLALARDLHYGLEHYGHRVFLDAADLQLGDEWPAVIQRELERADVLIVLLSRHIADNPDMVIEEVSMARELKRQRGDRPVIIPVCLGDDALAALPYDLAAMVKRLQLTVWSGQHDTGRLLKSLLVTLDPSFETGRGVLRGPEPVRRLRELGGRGGYGYSESDDRGPRRAVEISGGDSLGAPKSALSLGVGDELPPPQPPKTRYSRYWYVSREAAERQAAALLREPGSPVVLVGPDDIGKSYLLDHLVAVHLEEDDCAVRIELDLVDDTALGSAEGLFEELAFQIAEQLELDEESVDKAWELKKRRPASIRLRHFISASALGKTLGRLFLVIDRTDAVAHTDAVRGLFRELRSWAELGGRSSEPWDRLRLMLAVSTEPDRLTDVLESSPLDLTPPVRLDDLSRDQLTTMAQCYGLELRDDELDMLTDWIGGHPYLARKVMYQAATEERPLTELLARSDRPEGLFADHLRSRMLKVRRDDQLVTAVRLVVQRDRDPIDAEVAHRLLSSGLITGSPGAYRMRYKLYDSYFREWLTA
ncbi:MAG: AAA-like domain-containing protein [Acidobacteriota bacterium]